ncbi:MAG: GTP-binding protein [Meiothermus sp.]
MRPEKTFYPVAMSAKPPSADQDLLEFLKEGAAGILQGIGKVNIVVVGKTGVGKSTLINAVFQGELAKTGTGRPVTQHTQEISKPGVPVHIFDTKGLEVADYTAITQEITKLVSSKAKNSDPLEHIHLAWLCIPEGTKRVEEAEIVLARALAKQVPVIVVLTKSVEEEGFAGEVGRLIPEARFVIPVLAKDMPLRGGVTFKAFGLEELVARSMEVLPEGVRMAFAAAQKASITAKQEAARQIVTRAAVAASGAATVPIPLSDAVLISGVQVAMLGSISKVWGLNLERGFFITLLSSLLGTMGATLVGRTVAGGLVKLIPGLGSLIGATVNATTAATLTKALGEAYIATLTFLTEGDPERVPTPGEVAAELRKRLGRVRANADADPQGETKEP